jgi:hypothetical protein
MNLLQSSVYAELNNAMAETFETLAFSEVLGFEKLEKPPSPPEDIVGSSVEIQKPVKANLSLFMSRDHLKELIERVYGNEVVSPGGDSEAFENDFLNELVNTIGGRFGDSLRKRGKLVKLGLPFIVAAFPASGGDNLSASAWLSFAVEDRKVFCWIEEIG